jgi:hypothetical protein
MKKIGLPGSSFFMPVRQLCNIAGADALFHLFLGVYL